jgi:hypothetical protein
MSRMITAADESLELASALGRFSQAAAFLEKMVLSAIVRLLPMTNSIGNVAFAANTAQRNREILDGLLDLEEVPIPIEWRTKLKTLIPKIRQLQEDRNRLLHNVIADGGQNRLTVMRATKSGYIAHFVTISEINNWSIEASEMAAEVGTVPHAVYDLSQWQKAWPQYNLKDWPGRRP